MRAKRNALPFHISLVGRKNLSQEIYRQIKCAILDGRLKAGDRLSPTRELARALAVSRMTVTEAYEQLAGEGFALSKQGAGTFVSEAAARVARRSRKERSPGALQPRPIWDSIPPPITFKSNIRFDFRVGLPDGSRFPREAWRRSVCRALDANESAMGVYEDPAGNPGLRVAIARQISYSRGVETSAEDIVVTSGTQQALDVIARVLLGPGDTIAVEDPGYGIPRLLFNSQGLNVVGVPVDRSGLVVEALPQNARAVYVTPSHQFPLSVTMSLERRQALLAWAERNGAAIIEDDYDSEFRFGGRPCEPLQTLDTQGRVLYVGSFSKTLLPSLRVGFIVAPPSLRLALRKAKFVGDWHTPTLVQAAVAGFMNDGGFARHIRKMTGVYRKRREIVADIVARDFADHLELVPSSVGLHLAAWARNATLDEIREVAQRASACDVAIHVFPIRVTNVNATPIVAFGYGAIETSRIKEGLALLRDCFESKSR